MTRDEICSNYLESLPFDLYPVQEEALLAWFEEEGGVLVAAPTGMGKTLIAEAAIYEALHSNSRLYYTTPLIALTEQKFREFQDSAERWGFPRESIGLITGNRRENPDAPVRVVVAEILLNHLIGQEERFDDVSGVVMDEFHSFNDPERGIVWELSLVLLPKTTRVLLLSATVGNAPEFLAWLRREHGRGLRLVQSDERRVPLEYVWVGDKLLTEHLPTMVSNDDAENRTPALVFCFNRDECWDVAEKLKGLKLIDEQKRKSIEELLDRSDFENGVGPKLWQMLIRGVGVHHAGVLPKHKLAVERAFNSKLVPFVICTETLAAGINLPARSVVLTTLLKGPKDNKKVAPPSTAHQIFGRAGRPQFDTQGYVYSLAHDDDVKIEKWKRKMDQIDANSKDPGILRMRKQLEKKRPSRRKTVQYWTEGQFESLIKAGPGKLYSRSMIPYQVLIYLLTRDNSLADIRDFLRKRFNTPERLEKFVQQLDFMIDNLVTFGFLKRDEGAESVTVDESIQRLLVFRSVDPLYGDYLCRKLVRASLEEKIQAVESVLPLPPVIERKVRIPFDLPVGPLQEEELKPELITMGIALVSEDGELTAAPDEDEYEDYLEPDKKQRPLLVPEMLKLIFEQLLAAPENVQVQPKWIAGRAYTANTDFYKLVQSCELVKQEGLVLRHLLRLVILAEEFHSLTEDPDYRAIGEFATEMCHQVDPSYTDRFLADAHERRSLDPTL